MKSISLVIVYLSLIAFCDGLHLGLKFLYFCLVLLLGLLKCCHKGTATTHNKEFKTQAKV